MGRREADATHLSTARINRLLRPLRNRCTTLAVFIMNARRTATGATYSSRIGCESDLPPLAILQPPGSIGARIHFDRHRVEGLEMSQKVYAVRDYYKEIVLKTTGKEEKVAVTRRTSSRIMSLAAMCSIFVGENIEGELMMETTDREGTDFASGLYDAVPPEYRRLTALSHALDIILNTCPPHATLLSILLDVTLAHDLLHESGILLRSLLFVALSSTSPSNATPRLCHPTHGAFLTDLRARWTGVGFPDRGFFRILLEALNIVQNTEVWTCKAINKLAHGVCYSDLPLFITLVGQMVTSAEVLVNCNARSRKLKDQGRSTRHITQLVNQLHKWVNLASNHCVSLENSVAPVDVLSEKSEAILDFLKSSLASRLYSLFSSTNNTTPPEPSFQDAIVCLATQWLSGYSSFVSSSDIELIVRRLWESVPHTSTYNSLITSVLTTISLDACKKTLRTFATYLSSYGLLRLEASMWACALRHIELPTCERRLTASSSANEVQKYRRCLIDLVDDAEKRCFGLKPVEVNETIQSQRNHNHHFSSETLGRPNSDWQWEPIIGCWIRRSSNQPSVRKRRRITNDRIPRFSERLHRRRHCSSSKRLSSLPKPVTRSSLTEGHCDAHINSENDGTYGHKHGTIRIPLLPRSSNFTSLLADAFSQRTVLHPKEKTKHRFHESQNIVWSTTAPSTKPKSPNNLETHHNILPSDDSLDLFACGSSSSPARF